MNNQQLNITQSVQQYISNLYARKYTPCIRINGSWYYLWNGKKVPEMEFKKLFPLSDKVGPFHLTREDVDGTHIH